MLAQRAAPKARPSLETTIIPVIFHITQILFLNMGNRLTWGLVSRLLLPLQDIIMQMVPHR
jgi:hypothetical protein